MSKLTRQEIKQLISDHLTLEVEGDDAKWESTVEYFAGSLSLTRSLLEKLFPDKEPSMTDIITLHGALQRDFGAQIITDSMKKLRSGQGGKSPREIESLMEKMGLKGPGGNPFN